MGSGDHVRPRAKDTPTHFEQMEQLIGRHHGERLQIRGYWEESGSKVRPWKTDMYMAVSDKNAIKKMTRFYNDVFSLKSAVMLSAR